MIDVLNLALPALGLLPPGPARGPPPPPPATALGWMNFFIVYV